MIASADSRAWTLVRRVLLAALLVGGAAVLLLAAPRTCRDAVAEGRVVSVCEPLGVTSPQAALLAVALGLLLLPELAEVQLGGVVTLRRQLDETTARTAALEADLVSLRASSAAASTSASEVHLHLERQAATSAALSAAAAPGRIPPPGTPGMAALIALRAGVLGLVEAFPTPAGGARLVGYTLADADRSSVRRGPVRLELTHDFFRVEPALLAVATRLINPPRATPMFDAIPGWWLAGAPARDEDGRWVGALVVLARPWEQQQHHPLTPQEQLVAAVEVAAEAYARLLIDLLGERPVQIPGQGEEKGSQ